MKSIKTLPIGVVSLLLFVMVLFGIVRAQGEAQPSDPAAFYKAKCVACHGQKAEKKFDPALTDDQYIDVILKGKKPEKPPNMPAYGEKGVTAEQAKGLLDYMKQLRAPQWLAGKRSVSPRTPMLVEEPARMGAHVFQRNSLSPAMSDKPEAS